MGTVSADALADGMRVACPHPIPARGALAALAEGEPVTVVRPEMDHGVMLVTFRSDDGRQRSGFLPPALALSFA